jgi:uncharacterized membrane protein YeaQ/YmgE (transglycosylase-associated protein family)
MSTRMLPKLLLVLVLDKGKKNKVGFGKVTGFDLRSLIIAVGGSIILLVIYRALKR